MSMASPEAPNVTSIERTFSILEMLDKTQRGWNISEMSRKLNIPKSSAHVIFLTLERLGYIKKEASSKRYQLGIKVYGLGRSLMKNLDLPDLALPHMRWLVEQTKLTAHLGVLEKNKAVFIQKVDGPGMIKFDTYIGKGADVHCTGLGKALLAYAPEEIAEEVLAGSSFQRHTKTTICKPAKLKKALSQVKSKGYSVDDEEEELGVRCIAAPIMNHVGETVAAVSVTGTIFQIEPARFDEIGFLVIKTSARISRALQKV